jgi:hypothetical protein
VPARYLVAGGIVCVTLWAVVSTLGFVGSRDGPARPPSREPLATRGSAHRVTVRSLAEVRTEIERAGLGSVLVLTVGRPRAVSTYVGGRGLFAETVYRVRQRRVVLRQSTAAPPGARLLLAYVEDVPGTAQSAGDFYWADRGYVLSLSRTGARVAGEMRWLGVAGRRGGVNRMSDRSG